MTDIVVLQSSPHGNAADLRSDALLVAAAEALGHSARIVRAEDLARRADGRPDGVAGVAADVVLPRADLRGDDALARFVSLVRAWEARGARCRPSAEGLAAAQDKMRTHERLSDAGIRSVPTILVAAGTAPPCVAFPAVVKPPVDWGGRGVLRCNDAAALIQTIAALPPGGRVLVQPFMPHRRCITVQVAAGRVVGAFATLPVGDDFRSNARLGGRTYDVAIAEETARVAVRAAAACGLRSGSVDFLDVAPAANRRGDAPPVVEVNSMPGLWPHDAGDRAFAAAIVAAAAEDAA